MKINFLRLLAPAWALLLLTVGHAHAVSVTYDFTQFGAGGQTTPLLNVAPDSGPAFFLANFTSAPNANGFTVANFQPNGLFSGNSLFEPVGSTGNDLFVTLNTAVDTVSLVFATNGPGRLFFVTPFGGTNVASTAQSGLPGGILTFSSATPFSLFGLFEGDPQRLPIEFAIDNLTMRIASVPDGGSTLAMGGMAALLLLG